MSSETVMIDILPVLIKAIASHNVGLSWMIKTMEQYYFSFDKCFSRWCTGGPWYNKTIFQNLHKPISEVFFLYAKTDVNWCVA